MATEIVYDKDGKKIPSREFLSMIIIMLRKAGQETGGESLLVWLRSLASEHDDVSLRKAVYNILKENYLDTDTTNYRQPEGEAEDD